MSPLPQDPNEPSPFMQWLKGMLGGYKTDTSLRVALEEYIQATPDEGTADITLHERLMLGNVLKMRDLRVKDVMVPRAEIVAVDVNISHDEFLLLLGERQFSRIPVYRGTLDDVIGTIHIKDVIARLTKGEGFTVRELARDVPVVSPSLPISDLIMQMRETRRHMVMVVDEYGGIDGLVTIGDVIEMIFGQMSDEYGQTPNDLILMYQGDTCLVDTRLTLTAFEESFGPHFTDAEKAENDTISGLICQIAGRVPTRGEVIQHTQSPLRFEIVDADIRRIYSVRVKNIPKKPDAAQTQ